MNRWHISDNGFSHEPFFENEFDKTNSVAYVTFLA
jgi:hypothetical protein